MGKRHLTTIAFVFALTVSTALTGLAQTMPNGADPALWAKALRLHRSAIIIDGHNDVTGPMVDEDHNLAENKIGRAHV